MGRKQTNYYKLTDFALRISELQEKNGFTNEDIVEKLLDDCGEPLIENTQTYTSYKTGKRQNPRRFPELLKALSRLYNVSVDYLVGADDVPNRQIKSVQDALGLSEEAISNLMQLNKSYPVLFKMINLYLSSMGGENTMHLVTVYNHLLGEYQLEASPIKKENKSKDSNDTDDTSFIETQNRFIFMQWFYDHLKNILIPGLTESFENELLVAQDLNAYYNSEEYINKISSDDCNVNVIVSLL